VYEIVDAADVLLIKKAASDGIDTAEATLPAESRQPGLVPAEE